MKTTDWLIVDVETDGLMDPIHVVEIAAQRMRGWDPAGEKFRVLLNHNVPIPSAAVALHGYTEDYLRKNGEDPAQAHGRFRDFAGNLPVVAHNLSFDWNRALCPEWARLGLSMVGQRGFCSLMLSRRVVDETKSYSMDALRRTFGLSGNFAHRAFGDVDALSALFSGVFRPRLEGAGISTFGDLVQFSSRTPVAKCLSAVRSSSAVTATTSNRSADNWYFIDTHDRTHGPLPASEVLSFMGGLPCWIWKEGLPDWVSSQTCEEFLQALRMSQSLPRERKGEERHTRKRSLEDLIKLCHGILADGIVTTEEVVFLSKWLEEVGATTEWPWTELGETVERIMADSVITDLERDELQALLQRVGAVDPEFAICKPGQGGASRKSTTGEAVSGPSSESIEIELACGCGQHLVLDSAAGGRAFACPNCGNVMRVSTAPQADSAPATTGAESSPTPDRPSTKMELMCVGNAGSGYLDTQIRVMWFEVLVDEDRKEVDVIEHLLPIKNHHREKRVNFCEYDVPEGVVCFYDRHVQTKPNVYESKFFRIENGQFQSLGEGAQSDFCGRFLSEYGGYDVCLGSSGADVKEKRQRHAELDGLRLEIHIPTQGGSDCRERNITRVETSSLDLPPLIAMGQSFSHTRPAFSVVQLTQGTAEWIEWRKGGIGASDAPAIMGENPWKTQTELLHQKSGLAQPTEADYAMSRGTALEPEARQAYISRTGKWMQPACLQSTAYEWLRASVDGITSTFDAVVEIKCGRSVYGSTSKSGRVPGHYYGQLQHILAVTGLSSIDFWCYLPGLPEVLVPVERDDRYIARLLEAEYRFWTDVARLRLRIG